MDFINQNFKKLTSLVVVTLTVSLFAAIPVAAQQLADSADNLVVTAPAANARLKGTTTFTWQNFDDDQATVPFQLTLRDRNLCSVEIGVIAAGTKPSSLSQTHTVSWPTAGPIQNQASIADGNYCLELCVSLKDGAGSYTACNSRGITIRNNNANPQITSTPPADRTILRTQTWTYDVNATDANGDKLTYSFQQAPNFLQINTATGLITTISNNKNPGTYTVIVRVSDGFGGTDTQSWQLVVQASTSSSSSSRPSSSSSATSTSTTTSATSSTAAAIKFVEPTGSSIFKGTTNTVKWQASDVDGIDKLILNYIIIGEDPQTKEIVTLAANETQYSWDVSKLPDGDYRLELIMADKKGNTTSATSEQFKITNQSTGETPSTARPLIIDIAPEDLANITTLKPVIAGKFSPAAGTKIDTSTFTFSVNQVDRVSWCNVTETAFSCQSPSNMNIGAHKVQVGIKDDKSQLAAREWTFTIVEEQAATPSDGIVILGRFIPYRILILGCVICLVGLILFLIPWLLYNLWRRRQQQQTVYEETTDTNYVEPTYYDTAASTTPFVYTGAAAEDPQVTVNYLQPEAAQTTPFDPTMYYQYPGMEQAAAPAPAEVNVTNSTPPAPEPAPVVKPEPTPVVVNNNVTENPTPFAPADPAQFDNYQDYLNAVSAANATEAATIAKDSNENTQNYISTPDYMSFYQPPAETSEPEEVETAPAPNAGGLFGGFGSPATPAKDPLEPAKKPPEVSS